MTQARVEDVRWIEAPVMLNERGLRGIEVADIVLRRIFGAAPVQDLQHLMLYLLRVGTFSDKIVLMEDVAEKVAVVDGVKQLGTELLWKTFEPLRGVAR